MNENLQFLQAFLKNPLKVGAVAPSSPDLAAEMLHGIEPDENNIVLELGVGTGAITKYLQEIIPMKPEFKVGDHVSWNSEAGRVRGTIKKKVTSAMKFKTYTVRASKKEPQYLIQSDKTDHIAMHKGSALKKITESKRGST